MRTTLTGAVVVNCGAVASTTSFSPSDGSLASPNGTLELPTATFEPFIVCWTVTVWSPSVQVKVVGVRITIVLPLAVPWPTAVPSTYRTTVAPVARSPTLNASVPFVSSVARFGLVTPSVLLDPVSELARSVSVGLAGVTMKGTAWESAAAPLVSFAVNVRSATPAQ